MKIMIHNGLGLWCWILFCYDMVSPSCTERISVSGDYTKRIGEWKNNRQSVAICINIGGSLYSAPVGKAPRTQVSFRIFFYVHSAWPTRTASIAAPIVLGPRWMRRQQAMRPELVAPVIFIKPMSWIFLGSWRMAYWRRINRGANSAGATQGTADTLQRIPFCYRTRLFFELYWAETEKDSIQDGGPMKRQKSIQHRSPKPLSII